MAAALLASCADLPANDKNGGAPIRQSGLRNLYTPSDKEIETNIATELYRLDKGSILVDIHSIDGHVYMAGITDNKHGTMYRNAAKKVTGVRQVSAKWFPVGTDDITPLPLKDKIEAALAEIKEPIILKMIGRNVILFGAVNDPKNINRAVNSVKKIKSVKTVTNFLTIKRKKS